MCRDACFFDQVTICLSDRGRFRPAEVDHRKVSTPSAVETTSKGVTVDRSVAIEDSLDCTGRTPATRSTVDRFIRLPSRPAGETFNYGQNGLELTLLQ